MRETLAVAVVSIVATAVMFYLKYPPRLPYADEFEYLGYAFGLFKFDVFGQVVNPDIAPENTMFFPPLYPYFLSFMMSLDATFANTIECVLRTSAPGADGALTSKGCSPSYGLVIPMQVLLAGLALFCVWGTARRLSGSVRIAIFAVILAFAAKGYVYYANYFLTENLTLSLAAALGWAMVAAWQERTMKYAAISALLFGLLVLTRAGWGYAALVVVPIFILMGLTSWRSQGLRAFSTLVVFGVVYAAVLSPWVVRNIVVFDAPALTGGYGDKALSHRLPYNRMTNNELKAAFVYWLPDFGDSLAAKLFPKEQYERLDFGAANGFYASARFAFLTEAHANRGEQSLYDYLIEHEIVGNLGKHVAVTMAMVWRGMFVAKIWGLVAWVFFLPLLLVALFRGWGAFIVLAAPPLFMLGLNAFVSVSIPRYNMALIPVLSFSVAYVLSQAALRLSRKHKEARAI